MISIGITAIYGKKIYVWDDLPLLLKKIIINKLVVLDQIREGI